MKINPKLQVFDEKIDKVLDIFLFSFSSLIFVFTYPGEL
jgi:hypothetical protein